MEKLITIIIPTYNRPEQIKDLLSNITYEYCSIFKFEIHDSSSNNEVEEEVNAALISDSRLSEIISYFRYPDNLFVDDKCMLAFKNCTTKYFFLIRDTWIIDYDKLAKDFLRHASKDVDVLCLLHENLYPQFSNFTMQENVDPNEYFRDYLWYAPLYGCCITKTEIFNQPNREETYEKYKNSEFFFPCMIFEYLASKDSPKIDILKVDYTRSSKVPKKNGWNATGKFLKIWTYNFYSALIQLPDFYQNKESTIKEASKKLSFYGLRSLIRFRIAKDITFKSLKTYKKYIKKTSTKYPTMLLLCFIPRWFLKFIYTCYKKNKKQY